MLIINDSKFEKLFWDKLAVKHNVDWRYRGSYGKRTAKMVSDFIKITEGAPVLPRIYNLTEKEQDKWEALGEETLFLMMKVRMTLAKYERRKEIAEEKAWGKYLENKDKKGIIFP